MKRSDLEKFVPGSNAEYDVIVAGAGPAGIGAALAAADQGSKVLVLEAGTFFGGTATEMHWMPLNRLFINGGQSRGGIHETFINKLKSLGPDAAMEGRKSWIAAECLNIHPDYLRLALFEVFEEAGIHYRLHSPVVGTVMEGNKVTGVKVLTKDGIDTFKGKVIIDATGDGDVAYHAGAKMVKGRETDGKFMGITLGFCVSNVDTEKFFDWYHNHLEEFGNIWPEAEKEGYAVSIRYVCHMTTVPGFVSVNNLGPKDFGILDGTNMDHLTMAERAGLQLAVDFVKIVRKRVPGMGNCCLARVGADVAVRETRRIVGDHVMTIEDSIEGPEFDDVVARRYGKVDAAGLEDENVFRDQMKSGHAFPYRAFLPVGIEGLLVSGRCASATHLGQAAGKSIGNVMDLGQAAGVAAALCIKQNITPRQVDVKQVQKTLVDMGVQLYPKN